MAISFNVEPYWDDFETVGADGLSPKEKYNKVLFRPGKAVQARELTQLHDAWLARMAEPVNGAGKKWDPDNPGPPKRKNRNKNPSTTPTRQ